MDKKIQEALDALLGKPIEDFNGIMQDSLALSKLLLEHSQDKAEVDDRQLEILVNLFDVLSAACHYEDDCRRVAYGTARSFNADKNNAEKI